MIIRAMSTPSHKVLQMHIMLVNCVTGFCQVGAFFSIHANFLTMKSNFDAIGEARSVKIDVRFQKIATFLSDFFKIYIYDNSCNGFINLKNSGKIFRFVYAKPKNATKNTQSIAYI